MRYEQFPKEMRDPEEVRMVAANFRYMQERCTFEREFKTAIKFQLVADVLDWACGFKQEMVQKFADDAKGPLLTVMGEEDFKHLSMMDACALLRFNSIQSIKDYLRNQRKRN